MSTSSRMRPNDGRALAAPEIATATSRPLPVCPIRYPAGMAIRAAIATDTSVKKRCSPMRDGSVLVPSIRSGEKIQAMASTKNSMSGPHRFALKRGRTAALGPRHHQATEKDQQHIEQQCNQHGHDHAGSDLFEDASLESVGEQVTEALHPYQDAHRDQAHRAHSGDAQPGQDHRAGKR